MSSEQIHSTIRTLTYQRLWQPLEELLLEAAAPVWQLPFSFCGRAGCASTVGSVVRGPRKGPPRVAMGTAFAANLSSLGFQEAPQRTCDPRRFCEGKGRRLDIKKIGGGGHRTRTSSKLDSGSISIPPVLFATNQMSRDLVVR